MGCGSSIAQEPTTKPRSQVVPQNSPKPTLVRADKFLSREEARERRQQAVKEKQLQSQNNAQAISAQALIDQERLSTSTKRSLRSYASSSTATPLKSGDDSKQFDAQKPISTSSNLTTHSEGAFLSLSPSKQIPKDDSVPPDIIVEENGTTSHERTELLVPERLASGEGDDPTLEHSENNFQEKSESLKDGEDIVTHLPEKLEEDKSVMKDGDCEIVKGETVRNELKEEGEGLVEEIETEPLKNTGDAESSVKDGKDGMNGDGVEETFEPKNSEEKGLVSDSDNVTQQESSVQEGQRSSDENVFISKDETAPSQNGRTENEGDEDEGTIMDHYVTCDSEVVKTSNGVGENRLNDASDGSDEGVADLGEMGEENELEVSPAVS